jgi:hypothetical protein
MHSFMSMLVNIHSCLFMDQLLFRETRVVKITKKITLSTSSVGASLVLPARLQGLQGAIHKMLLMFMRTRHQGGLSGKVRGLLTANNRGCHAAASASEKNIQVSPEAGFLQGTVQQFERQRCLPGQIASHVSAMTNHLVQVLSTCRRGPI